MTYQELYKIQANKCASLHKLAKFIKMKKQAQQSQQQPMEIFSKPIPKLKPVKAYNQAEKGLGQESRPVFIMQSDGKNLRPSNTDEIKQRMQYFKKLGQNGWQDLKDRINALIK